MSKTIGFVGTGVMGSSMVINLMKAGYSLLVYNRSKNKAQTCLSAGAGWCETIPELAKKADVVITIVGFPADVEEVYLGKNGILANAREGTTLIDMTTSQPALAARIYDEAKKKKMPSLDAPVSGGDLGAREARLSIMVGGDKETFDAMLPIFQAMGKNIVHQGKAGSGQHTKMCNQIAIACNMMGVCEALVYAQKAGLDAATVLQSISGGAAGSWSLTNLAPRIINKDFAPGFYIKHIIKDMIIAAESARAMGFHAQGLELSKSLYEQYAAQGGDNESEGTQALYKHYLNKSASAK
jgi:3-hydroxyisobutyrate dehydrogenase